MFCYYYSVGFLNKVTEKETILSGRYTTISEIYRNISENYRIPEQMYPKNVCQSKTVLDCEKVMQNTKKGRQTMDGGNASLKGQVVFNIFSHKPRQSLYFQEKTSGIFSGKFSGCVSCFFSGKLSGNDSGTFSGNLSGQIS